VTDSYTTEDQVKVDVFTPELNGRVTLLLQDLTDPEGPGWAMELSALDRAELASLLLGSLL
jgi:hypothetical protein